MEYHLNFDSDQLNMQDAGNAMAAEDIRKNIELTIGKYVSCKMLESKAQPGKVHYLLDCDGDIDDLLKAVDGKMEQIREFGIEKIVLWGFYEYCAQCNMEWTAEQLKLMGDNEIHFCVSCWEKEPTEIYKTVAKSIEAKFHNDPEIENVYAYWNNDDKQFLAITVFNNNKKEEIEKYVKDVFPGVDFVDVEIKKIKV